MDRQPRVPFTDDASSSKRSRDDEKVSHPVIPVKKFSGVMVPSDEGSSSQTKYQVEKLDVRPRKIRKTAIENPPSPIQRVPLVIDLTLSDSDNDDVPPPPPKPKAKQVKTERPSSQKSTKRINFIHTDSSDSDDDDSDGPKNYSLHSSLQTKDEERCQMVEDEGEDQNREASEVDELDSLPEDFPAENPQYADQDDYDFVDYEFGSSLSPVQNDDKLEALGKQNNDVTEEDESVIEKPAETPMETRVEDRVEDTIKKLAGDLTIEDQRESSQAPPSNESTSTQASEPTTPKHATPEITDKQQSTGINETPTSNHQTPAQNDLLDGVSEDEDYIDDGNDDDEDFYSTRQSKSPDSDDDFVTAKQPSSTTEDAALDTDYKRLPRHALKTGYVYDPIMSLHAQLDEEDDEPHPEDPRRIYRIFKCMEENGLLKNCVRLPIRQATKKEVLSTHDPRYIQTLEQTQDMSQKELEKEARKYNSIYMNAHSNESALFSAGGVIEACSAVATDKVQNAFAIVRPPGHHAEFDTAMGFCLMNNVAIAARYCKDHFPFVQRILILDWDIHFGNDKCKANDYLKTHFDLGPSSGNGTQQLTSRNADILYMSLHRYEKGTFYPQDNHGRASYVGRRSGIGRTVNIPWPNAGMTDGDYLYAFREIVMPIAMEFAPSLVIVSAGFDAAAGDHIGECHVTPAGYGQMTHMLKSIANGRIVLALEGGYNLESIAKSAHACMSVLMGEAPEIPTLLTPSPECVETIRKVKGIQSVHWDCLKY